MNFSITNLFQAGCAIPHPHYASPVKIRFLRHRVLDKKDVELYGNCKLGESDASNDAMMSWDNSNDYWSLKEIPDSTFLSVGKKFRISHMNQAQEFSSFFR